MAAGIGSDMQSLGFQAILKPIGDQPHFRIGELRVGKPIGRRDRSVAELHTLLRVGSLQGKPGTQQN
jgi:hypothetical protein